ncbi:MAG: hypothetical protein PWQ22_1526 [Archaeoglobaceae archaeon]|nr:hypothetical protein [Archaeoglobaceae archaeon]
MIGFLEKELGSGRREVIYPLKNWAEVYDIEDGVIRESLTRYFTLLLQNEFCSNFSKIKELEITKDKNNESNLLLRIRLDEIGKPM